MRRDEFKCDDFALIKTILSQMPFGTMVIPDTPLPYAVPVIVFVDKKGILGKKFIGLTPQSVLEKELTNFNDLH